MFRSSWPSAIVQGLIQHQVGNPLVVFDEIDKLADMSSGARENPAEALLPFLEPQTAGRVREHFLQIDLDLRFLNWVLLANNLDKVPRGGSVCLNSYWGLAKWISALVMLLPGLASAR